VIRRKDGTVLSDHGTSLDLSKQDARETDFHGAYLYGGDFSDSDLRGSDFRGAHLYGTDCYRANCSQCNFTGALLEGVSLDRANLDYATFVDARLAADSIGGGCSLCATDLRFTTMGNVVLTGCLYDSLTLFPNGFDPVARGMVRVS